MKIFFFACLFHLLRRISVAKIVGVEYINERKRVLIPLLRKHSEQENTAIVQLYHPSGSISNIVISCWILDLYIVWTNTTRPKPKLRYAFCCALLRGSKCCDSFTTLRNWNWCHWCHDSDRRLRWHYSTWHRDYGTETWTWCRTGAKNVNIRQTSQKNILKIKILRKFS